MTEVWIKAYQELTADNHHGKALELLAISTGQKHYAEICRLINQIQDLERELPYHLAEYQSTIRKRVQDQAERMIPDIFDRLNGTVQ